MKDTNISMAKDLWKPKWVIDVGDKCKLGITIDDGCFIVLYPQDSGTWKPGKHIPKEVAERLGELVKKI